MPRSRSSQLASPGRIGRERLHERGELGSGGTFNSVVKLNYDPGSASDVSVAAGSMSGAS